MNIFTGELLGTFFLILFGGGVVANNLLTQSKGENAGWLSITVGWGIAVVLGIFVAQSTGSSQADLNPAVTLAKYIIGTHQAADLPLIFAAEFLGAFLGAIGVWLAYLPHWKATACQGKKLAVFSTSPAIKHPLGNLLSEIMGTAVLVLGVGAIFGNATSGNVAVGLGPYLVGLLVIGIGLSLGGATGYAINPARDLGPRLAHAVLPIAGKGHSDWGYAWIPVVGPLLGGTLGGVLWKLLYLAS